ncbi:hypothetical protein LTR17_013246 [Elasticomyces elasticus]|nr:hypothetical protein LTR17_013246 [Elasticomyces elasticus]
MQLDATKGKPSPNRFRPRKTGTPSDQQRKPFDKTSLACHNCGQKGHFGRNAGAKQDSHAGLSWTACYKDTCCIHQSDNRGSGWWPKDPKAQKVCVLRLNTTPVPEEESDDNSSKAATTGEDSLSSDEEHGSTVASTNNDIM